VSQAAATTVPGVLRPLVAIVGRPNVGKSSLFNRLVGRRRALVRDVPGVTRDRLYGQVEFERWRATVVDTGGFDPSSHEPLVDAVRRHVLTAIGEADLVLMVVDAREGVTALDQDIGAILHRSGRPVILVANKVDTQTQEATLGEFYRLGFGDPVPVSAEHGRGAAELLDALRARAPEPTPPAPAIPTAAAPRVAGAPAAEGLAARPPTQIAIIGRPNVGKSSLVNALVGAERVLVHAAPGTTRDAVDTGLVRRGRHYVLIDTAGIRRKGRVSEPLEKLAVVMALKSLERGQVAVLVLDAADGLTAQDAHIAGYADAAGRATVIAVNKWDLVPPGMVRRAEVVEQIRERLPFLDYAPICFTSATKSLGIADLFDAIDTVAAQAQRRVEAGAVAAALQEALARRPISIGGVPLTIQSARQVGIAPPTFAVRVNKPGEIHFSYVRYLVNALRQAFGFAGSPIRLLFRRAAGARPGRRRR
jgi:GTP-binding protein